MYTHNNMYTYTHSKRYIIYNNIYNTYNTGTTSKYTDV